MYRICIADDEEYIRQSILHRLDNMGISMIIAGAAEDGITARQLYETAKPDIYFVDIRMPGISGLDLIEQIKMENPGTSTRFVIISGYDDFSYMQRAIKMGVADYLKKPIQQDEFEEMIRSVCSAIDEDKRKRSSKSGTEQNYWDVFYQKQAAKRIDGTFLLLYHKGIRRHDFLKKIDAVCPADQWLTLSFHEIEDSILLYSRDIREQEARILLEKLRCCVAVKSGRQLSLQSILQELENCMGQRFCRRTPFVGESIKAGTYEKTTYIELAAALSNTKERHYEECIARIINDVFRNPEKACHISQVFQAVITEIANCYIRHGKPIPEKLRQEYMPLAMMKYSDIDTLQAVLTGYAEQINQEVIQLEKKKDITERIIQYLNQHFAEEISLSGLAEEFFLAPTYLAKRFKENTGKTVIQYLEELRLKNARELLQSSDLSISEIALKTGYSDSNYFARSFRKVCKVTPREYRNMHQTDRPHSQNR